MSNILQAFESISRNSRINLAEIYSGKNSVGEALEAFLRETISRTSNELSEEKKLQIQETVFSYFGNQNNPPNFILKDGDAIELKNIKGEKTSIPLSSSYPKAKLYSDDPRITESCRTCEDWAIKDIVYVIGEVKDSELNSLWMVYGDCYAAAKETYEKIGNIISRGINRIPDVEFALTSEIGKVSRVDPLGITDLRIKGMWSIENPRNVFSYLFKKNIAREFSLVAIMQEEKYLSFPRSDRKRLEENKTIQVKNVKIKNPNNPARLLKAKLITAY